VLLAEVNGGRLARLLTPSPGALCGVKNLLVLGDVHVLDALVFA
jgi:hypothetical protein